jgi:hypothetical protein
MGSKGARPAAALAWAVETFGPVAADPAERGLRLLEEAMELAQCLGVSGAQADALALRVWGRDPGLLHQEFAQVLLCLEAAAAASRVDLDAVAEKEFARIQKLPASHHRRRHEVKKRGGIAT